MSAFFAFFIFSTLLLLDSKFFLLFFCLMRMKSEERNRKFHLLVENIAFYYDLLLTWRTIRFIDKTKVPISAKSLEKFVLSMQIESSGLRNLLTYLCECFR